VPRSSITHTHSYAKGRKGGGGQEAIIRTGLDHHRSTESIGYFCLLNNNIKLLAPLAYCTCFLSSSWLTACMESARCAVLADARRAQSAGPVTGCRTGSTKALAPTVTMAAMLKRVRWRLILFWGCVWGWRRGCGPVVVGLVVAGQSRSVGLGGNNKKWNGRHTTTTHTYAGLLLALNPQKSSTFCVDFPSLLAAGCLLSLIRRPP
jgi:hypothetical protein